MKIITKTGSEYIVRNGLFSKNQGESNTVYEMFFFDLKDLSPGVKGWTAFWEFAKTMPKTAEPEIGKHMYIAGRDVWWISTEIVGVEE